MMNRRDRLRVAHRGGRIMQRAYSLALGTLLFVSCAGVRVLAAPNDSIAFLRFRLVEGRLSAAGAVVAPGTLKTPKVITPVSGRIYYAVRNGEMEMLFEGVIPDPARTRYEYVDAQGRLQFKEIVSDSVEFYVRVPYRPDVKHAEFSRIAGVSVQAGKALVQKLPLGSVDVAFEVRKDD